MAKELQTKIDYGLNELGTKTQHAGVAGQKIINSFSI